MKSMKKLIEKAEYQKKVNPGHKEPYKPPLRPRSAVFKSGKRVSRQQMKIDIKKGKFD